MKIILFIVDVRWLGARVAPWVTPAMEWRLGVVVVTTTQLHSPKPQLKILRKFKSCSQCVGDDGYFWQWSLLEIRLNALRQSTIPQKQFIIIIIVITMAEVRNQLFVSGSVFSVIFSVFSVLLG